MTDGKIWYPPRSGGETRERIRLAARKGKAVRQALARGEVLQLDTASEEIMDYIPDELQWETPPFRRRKRKRK